MEFEWDSKKAIANERKHGVAFEEASTIFGDPLAFTFLDPDHTDHEQRFITFGLSRYNRFLIVSLVERGERIRIISARLMTRKERKIYEEG